MQEALSLDSRALHGVVFDRSTRPRNEWKRLDCQDPGRRPLVWQKDGGRLHDQARERAGSLDGTIPAVMACTSPSMFYGGQQFARVD